MNNIYSRTVIVADGTFPVHEIPLSYLRNAERIICCDGSADKLLHEGFIPDAIVGDMDSIDNNIAERFSDRIYRIDEQETNDLTKAVRWCTDRDYFNLVIVGATGKREDHTIGNVSLLAEYIKSTKIIMVTDTGFFLPILKSTIITSFPGQQISIFSIDGETEISSHGLRYPLKKTRITNWWQATLNEAAGDTFTLDFTTGRVIVYLKFKDS